MDIPRNDMLPDESQTKPVVSEDVKTQEESPEIEVSEDEPKSKETTQESKKGSKTDETQLYTALKEERNKRKELEEKIKELEESSVSSEFLDEDSLSIEGKMLKKRYDSLEQKLATLEKQREEEQIFVQYPQLKDKHEEFNEFRENPDNSGMSLKVMAKAFLIEHDMLETSKPRKGLEKPTGGSKSGVDSSTITAADVDRLMKTQPRKFIEMVRSGKIKAEDIK